MTATRRDRSTPTPDDAGPVDRMLVELLELPVEQRVAALSRMAAQHPQHKDELQRRWQWLESYGFVEPPGEPSSMFGPFRLLRRLGGGMTDVHLVEDTRTGAQVVLKRLQQPHLLSAAVRDSLRLEALAASRLQHPSIGTVLEFAECDGVPYLVQPFLGDTTLRGWIDQRRAQGRRLGPGDVHLAIAWIEGIARALQVAHANGLVHRDVKPDNIVLQAPGPPVLIDFGLCQAQELQPDGTPSPAAGTLPYMAPELLSSRDGARGPAADIYALGVTLFEAVTLRLPFHADSRPALCRMILSGDRTAADSRMRELPPGLRRVLDCAMAREAWERYATAAAMADDLQRLRRGQRPRAPGTSLPARARRWARRHRFTASLAALAACAVVLLGWMQWQSAQLAMAASDGRYLLFAERLRGATERADRLVPGWPDRIPALRAWLHEVEGWLAEQRRWPTSPGVRQDGEATPELRAAIAQAAAVHAEFLAPRGPLALVRRQLEWAQQVQQVSIDDHAALWQETCDAIAASRHYGGLRIGPQYDLVPLGPDPESGLFEFYHLPSSWPGLPPMVRRRTDKALVPHDFAGVVLVLIPGGEFTMGQQAIDPAAARYDPLAPIYDSPHRVTVGPFFLSKYELTRQQWFQLNGDQPSYSLTHLPDGGHRCPVTQVSAEQCDLVLARVGLVLPTEAQWEWATGRGASTRWYFGDDPAELPRHANLDGDPFPTLAPVGRFAANPAGLHDVYGNVSEWCRDAWMDYRSGGPRAGDGLRIGDPARHYHRVHRGGAYTFDDSVRTSMRYDEPPTRRSATIGVRPARLLQLEEPR